MTIVDDDLTWRMHQTSGLDIPQRIHGTSVDQVNTSDPDLQGRVEAVEDEAGVHQQDPGDPHRGVVLEVLHLLLGAWVYIFKDSGARGGWKVKDKS